MAAGVFIDRRPMVDARPLKGEIPTMRTLKLARVAAVAVFVETQVCFHRGTDVMVCVVTLSSRHAAGACLDPRDKRPSERQAHRDITAPAPAAMPSLYALATGDTD